MGFKFNEELGKLPKLATFNSSKNLSATSHSDVQYVESLWTIRHYVMRPTNCRKLPEILSVYLKSSNCLKPGIPVDKTINPFS